MNRSWVRSAVVAAILLASAPALAHEECDEEHTKPAGTAKQEDKPPVAAATAKITVKLFQYEPGRLQVSPGATVVWINEDEIFHSVTGDNEENGLDGSLDGKGKSFSYTFSRSGIYTYHCDRHEHMRGEIVVR